MALRSFGTDAQILRNMQVEDIENREFLCNLFLSMYEELPAPKRKKNTSKNNDKKPLAMSFIPTAKGFLIWIIRCTIVVQLSRQKFKHFIMNRYL